MHNENLVSQVKFKLAWILTRKHLISATFYLYWIGIDQNLFTALCTAAFPLVYIQFPVFSSQCFPND